MMERAEEYDKSVAATELLLFAKRMGRDKTAGFDCPVLYCMYCTKYCSTVYQIMCKVV